MVMFSRSQRWRTRSGSRAARLPAGETANVLRYPLLLSGGLALAGTLAALAPEANATLPSESTRVAQIAAAALGLFIRSGPLLLVASAALLVSSWYKRPSAPAPPPEAGRPRLAEITRFPLARALPAANGRTTPSGIADARVPLGVEQLGAKAPLLELSQLFDQIDSSVEPLTAMLGEHERIEARFHENLERTLLPLIEYADREQANLRALIDSSEQAADGLPAGAVDIMRQHERAETIRADGRRREAILSEHFDLERGAITAALSGFDSDVTVLNAQLIEARRTAERIVDALRSTAFCRAADVLQRRVEWLDQEAARGASTIEGSTPEDTISPASAMENPHLRRVLAALSPDPATAMGRASGLPVERGAAAV
jgi:hypothetical protein